MDGDSRRLELQKSVAEAKDNEGGYDTGSSLQRAIRTEP